MNEKDTDEPSQPASHAAVEMARRKRRRLAIHRAVVHVLAEHPERLSRAAEVLGRWEGMHTLAPALVQEWWRIIEDRDWASLLEDTEGGDSLRKGSPFAFILNADERLAIFRQYSRAEAVKRTPAQEWPLAYTMHI